MKYKSIASPDQGLGMQYKEKKIVVPNQALSLREILQRFTRDMSLPIGQDAQFGGKDDTDVLDVDLEKMGFADLVDQADFVQAQKDVQARYEEDVRVANENAKKRRHEQFMKDVEAELRKKIAAEQAEKGGSAK